MFLKQFGLRPKGFFTPFCAKKYAFEIIIFYFASEVSRMENKEAQVKTVSEDNIYRLNGRVPLSKAIPFGLA